MHIPLSGTGKKGGEGMRGNRLHWQVRGRTSSPTGDGSRRGCYGDMEFGIPRRFLCPGQGKKRVRGRKGGRLHWRVHGSTSSPTGIGSKRRVV